MLNMTSNLYPLRFEPLFRRYIWGGRRLGTELGKPIGQGDDFAESWEIVDHGSDQSVISAGELKGKQLGDLVMERTVELLGRRVADQITLDSIPANLRNRFPLLLKFLDANRDLSVQVHPNDQQGSVLLPPDLGKTEAWIVMAAEPGSRIYAGLKSGVDKYSFVKSIEENRIEETLHSFEPKQGDCVFIPSGTVHAIGAGLLIAEIQQSSDTTFRLFDWNRTDANGNSRELHIEAGVEATDFSGGPAKVVQATDESMQKLVQCDKFSIDRHRISKQRTLSMRESFKIIAVIDGEVSLSGDPSGQTLSKGQTALLPACLQEIEISTDVDSEIMVAGITDL